MPHTSLIYHVKITSYCPIHIISPNSIITLYSFCLLWIWSSGLFNLISCLLILDAWLLIMLRIRKKRNLYTPIFAGHSWFIKKWVQHLWLYSLHQFDLLFKVPLLKTFQYLIFLKLIEIYRKYQLCRTIWQTWLVKGTHVNPLELVFL